MSITRQDPISALALPPGFRFYPTDEELLVHYLCRKIAGYHFSLQIIGEIDLYKFDPWILPSKANFGEKEWYFFSPRDRKYPNGSRPNRVAGSGYWKATGTDKTITTEGWKIGIKKALVFYVGKAPKGAKTNWIMHEYRLSEISRKKETSRLDDWVLCRIYKKNSSSEKPVFSISSKEQSNGSTASSSSHRDESIPEINESFFADLPRMNSLNNLQQYKTDEKLNFQNVGSEKFDWGNIASLCSSMPELVSDGTHAQGQVHRPTNSQYFPSIPPFCHVESSTPSEKLRSLIEEEEVKRRSGTRLVENSGFYRQNSNAFLRSDSA